MYRFSDEELDDRPFPGNVETTPIYTTFNALRKDELPSDLLQQEYKKFRESLDEQRDKQYLFLAKLNLFAEENESLNLINRFVTLRHNARRFTYQVRKIYESKDNVELENLVLCYFNDVTNELNNNVNKFALDLSNKLIIKEEFCTRI
jgi:hypothetical protein